MKKPYEVMREALDQVHRDIVFSLCQYGMGNVWEWGAGVGGNCWRTTGDITDTWSSMSRIGFSQAGHEQYAGPGHWNDPDMLVVGMVGWGKKLHPTKLGPNEQYTHISLWCLLSAPLLIGCDMAELDDFTLNLLTNDEVLEISQDPLGKQARRVTQAGNLEVWAKPLEDGSMAVGLFNRGESEKSVTANWSDLGVSGKLTVRDLWRQKDLGEFEHQFSASVRRHGVVLVRLIPAGKAAEPDAGNAADQGDASSKPAPAVQDYPIKPVPFTAVHLSDVFWAPRIEINRTVTIPFAFEQCEKSGRMDNFDRAAAALRGEELKNKRPPGFPFDDTDPYKVLEGASYCAGRQARSQDEGILGRSDREDRRGTGAGRVSLHRPHHKSPAPARLVGSQALGARSGPEPRTL